MIQPQFWSELSDNYKQKILLRSEQDIQDVESIVRPILEDVRLNGDEAIRKYALKFDKATLADIKVSDAEFERANRDLPQDIKGAIDQCARNIRIHHEQQMQRVEPAWLDEVSSGVYAGERVNPIPSVGLYVPRGKGAFPSVMYMLATPAIVAKVPHVVVVTPPTPEGSVDDASLYAAQACGVRDIYKVGGAQAIASLAYGTQTVPKVDKVVGPGNAFVSCAKRLLSNKLDAGMPAGPSEALIIADKYANAYNTALDVINEAEHGPDSASVLATDDIEFATEVCKHLNDLIEGLPEKRRDFCKTGFQTYGAILVFDTMSAVIDFANDYAVEHLFLKVKQEDDIIPKLTNVGEILIGEHTPIVMGNYGVGVNAVLPTGRHARTWSCTSVWDFLKRTSIARMDAKGYDSMKDAVVKLAHFEGFPGHAQAIEKRKF